MTNKFIVSSVLFLLICCQSVKAQYAVADIPQELKENADLVVRLSEENIYIKDKGNAVLHNHYVYTIMNSAADEHANLVISYDKLRKVSSISGNLYGADGIKIRSLKKSEVRDYSNTSESNLADDDRVKHHNFEHKTYPYTIEYETEEEFNGIFYLPAWVPVFDENVSIQSSSLKVVAAPDYQLRFKAYNYTGEPQVADVKKTKEYSWNVSKLPAVKSEPYIPAWFEITPTVFIAPSQFKMQQYEGSMNNWQEFGAFIYKLNANRDVLPVAVKQKVHALTDAVNDPAKKVDILYKYLQQNTRYISIQLGIGGWQTLDATFVAEKGYGDCKALSNYMTALLKEAGIPAYTALIKSGSSSNEIISDFSSNQFNHVIVCVPQAKDSIWLECTSQTTPAGYMGSFTGNREALLISDKGGMLVRTPFYKASDNLQVRKIKGTISEQGELIANVNTYYSGTQQDRLDGMLKQSSNSQLAEYMRNKFDLTSYEVIEFSHVAKDLPLPSIEEKVKLKVPTYASVTGKRLFVTPNVLSVSSFKIKDVTSRKFDFSFKSAFLDTDTVEIEIPAGYKPESIPAGVDIRSATCVYKSSITVKDTRIVYTRSYKQEPARVPAAKTKELADFFDKVYKADHARIVFVKETP
ncbi:MAG: DUF3857 domain-containing protein [Ferruginibacter sp.]